MYVKHIFVLNPMWHINCQLEGRFKQSPIPVDLTSSARHAVNFIIIHAYLRSSSCSESAGVSNVITPRGGADALEDHEPWQNAMAKTTRAYGSASNRPKAPTQRSLGWSETIKIRCTRYILYRSDGIIEMTTILLFIIVVRMFDLYLHIIYIFIYRVLCMVPWVLLFRNKCFVSNIVGMHMYSHQRPKCHPRSKFMTDPMQVQYNLWWSNIWFLQMEFFFKSIKCSLNI